MDGRMLRDIKTPEEYRRPIEPIYNCGFRCKYCDIQLCNPSTVPGNITYCHRCGQAYDCASLWLRIKKY